jgi:hypothetical protein
MFLSLIMGSLGLAHDKYNVIMTHGVMKLIIIFSKILSFPIYTFLGKFLLRTHNLTYDVIGLILDCALWGTIVERIFYLFNKKRNLRLIHNK